MSNDSNDLWQICILTDTNKSILVKIDKNETVKNLFKKFREEHSGFQKERRLTFLLVDGLELAEDDGKLLDDVGLRDKCTVQLIVHLDGGVWPTIIEISTQIRNPNIVPTLEGRITNDVPDIMGLDDETPRVKMTCGHAIAPSSLALHCYNQIENGASEIKCPGHNCNVLWSFKSIIDAACLSPSETDEFERKMISNRLEERSKEIKKCPGCENYCRRLKEDKTRVRCRKCTSANGKNFYFCWKCLRKWQSSKKAVCCGNIECGDNTMLIKCLANCGTKKLNGIDCPVRRACPDCLTLVEHAEKCKHMRCPSKNCEFEFCFICLQHYPCETGLTGAHKPCTLAPRQGPTSFQDPTSLQGLKERRSSGNVGKCGNEGCGDHTALFECLENCETTTLNGIECPARRACPKCLEIIEHIENCKHMKCPTKHCKYEFCFICLQHYPCKTGAKKPCTLAPRQGPTFLCPPPLTAPRSCAIM